MRAFSFIALQSSLFYFNSSAVQIYQWKLHYTQKICNGFSRPYTWKIQFGAKRWPLMLQERKLYTHFTAIAIHLQEINFYWRCWAATSTWVKPNFLNSHMCLTANALAVPLRTRLRYDHSALANCGIDSETVKIVNRRSIFPFSECLMHNSFNT